MNIKDALIFAEQTLLNSQAARPLHIQKKDLRLDAEILLSFCLEKPRSFLFTWPEQSLSEKIIEQYTHAIKKRAENFPLAYLVGQQEFWSLNLKVSPDVLIPRPETECLVEFILEHFSTTQQNLHGLDLGTGSGAIALALASEKPHWFITACDQSLPALTIANQNKNTLHINNVEFLHSSWFHKIRKKSYDFIVSNPPYVEDDAQELQNESIQFEPRSALCSGKDGLNDITIICAEASAYLKPQGLLIIEHGYQQAKKVKEIFEKNNFNAVKCFNDYSHLNRFTIGFSNN